MQLNITGDFVKQVLEASPKNSDLPAQIAGQLLASIEPNAMAAYLLTKEAAVSLLAERLQTDATGTIKALQGLQRFLLELGDPLGILLATVLQEGNAPELVLHVLREGIQLLLHGQNRFTHALLLGLAQADLFFYAR